MSDATPLVIDGDYPMAYGAFNLGRDLTRPLTEVRAAAGDTADVAMASLPKLRRGGVAAALVKVVGRIDRPGNPLPGYASGDARHAAIGGNTDGQGGVEGAPAGVDSVADYRRMVEALTRRGYDEAAVAGVLNGNRQRLFERWLPA